jgi:Zn-dependent protease
MRGSFKIGRFAGVDTFVHWTFVLLLAWAGWTSYDGAGSGLAVLLGLAFLVGVFGSVLLHELGHALVARRYGVRTHNILLTPIGGIANLEGMPRAPKAEIAVALAGPAVNVAIAVGLGVFMLVTGWNAFGLLLPLLYANVSLALFNLIPAFPMDGGRALRAYLSMGLGSRRATAIAVGLGKVVAVLMAIAGFVFSPMLLVIAVFVWFAGAAESKAMRQEILDDEDAARWRAGDTFDPPWWRYPAQVVEPAYRRAWDSRPRIIVVRRGLVPWPSGRATR